MAGLTESRKREFFIAIISILALAMPNLNLGMSIGMILLFAYGFYYPGFRNFAKIRPNVPALLLIGLFGLHFFWLANTSDFAYAWKDIRIKLPLLILPLVLGSVSFHRSELKTIFFALSIGIWIASVAAYVRYNFYLVEAGDFRSIIHGISPVRLALMMSVLVAGIVGLWNDLNRNGKIYSLLCLANVLVIFNLIQSATGVAALTLVAVIAMFYRLKRHQKPSLTWLALGLTVVLIAGGLIYTQHYYRTYFTSNQDISDLPALTAKGNEYQHMPEVGIVENGDYTFNYICKAELIESWNDRSTLRLDESNEWILGALTRYLSSRGLTKDYAGVQALSDADIANIELGIPSVLYTHLSGLRLRYHVLLMGFHHYKQTGNASGYSFYQRIIYWNLAWKIIAQNKWFGVGTGDVKQEYADAYLEFQPDLDIEFHHRAHNQYLTFFIGFGIFGFLYFAAFAIFSITRASYSALAVTILAILFLSCLTEDTLESQAGATFFAFFFSLFSRPIGFDSKAQ